MDDEITEEKFTCNKCGKETDTGYFYCSECHELHKKKRDGSGENPILHQESETHKSEQEKTKNGEVN